MPHLMVDRLRRVRQLELCGLKGSTDFPVQEVAVGVLDLIAAFTFVLGSVGFLPMYSNNLPVFLAACILFFIGGSLLFAISLYAFVEAWQHHRSLSFEVLESMLYALGSWLFLVGTLLFWPPEAEHEHVELAKGMTLGQYFNLFEPHFEGSRPLPCRSILFALGSALFVFASFCNALNPRRLQQELVQLAACVTSLDMFGNMLFVVGSVAFLPEVAQPSSVRVYAIGAWSFLVGSIFLMIGCSLGIYRTMLVYRGGEARELLAKAP